MQVFNRLEDFQFKSSLPLTLALGFFDGVHLGHQKILKSVLESAVSLKTSPAVFTFQNHPQNILKPEAPSPMLITTPQQRLALLEKAGVKICFFLPFTEAFANLEAKKFVDEIIVKNLQAKKVCLGFNAHFGHARQGNAALMREKAAQWGFLFEEVGSVEVDGEAVSSSRIRKLIREGQIELANQCLGRPFSLQGEVVKGLGRGSQIGFPTANFEPETNLLPPEGVYPVEVLVEGGRAYQGVLNFGRRPTFKGGDPKPVMEAHLFDCMSDLYEKRLEVFFYPILRKERAFKGIPELQLQISKDVEAARRYFAQAKPGIRQGLGGFAG